jgi:hypothetical protein
MQRGRASSRCFKTGTSQVRDKTRTEFHGFSRIVGGWHGVDDPTKKDYFFQKKTALKKAGHTQGYRVYDNGDEDEIE